MTSNEQTGPRDGNEEKLESEQQPVEEEIPSETVVPTIENAEGSGRGLDSLDVMDFTSAPWVMSMLNGNTVLCPQGEMKARLQRNLTIVNKALEVINSPDVDGDFPVYSFHCPGAPKSWQA